MTEGTKVDGRFSPNKEAKMVFPNLKEAKAVMKNGKPRGEPKFGARILVTNPEDIAAIKKKAVEVARAKWPGVNLKTLKFPFSDGAKEAAKSKTNGKDGSFYGDASTLVVTARSKYQPRLSIYQGPNKAPQELDGPTLATAWNKFYSGAFVLPQWNFVAYDPVSDDGEAKAGVTAYLDQVMWIKDGQRIGAPSASEAFKHYQGSVSTEDPTGSAIDDEILS
jgi:hypothetical protein